MSDNERQLMDRLLGIFAEESAERLEAMTAGLLSIEASGAEAAGKIVVESLYREMHSLKGAARSVDLEEIEERCQCAEDLLAQVKRGEISMSREHLDQLHGWLKQIESLVSAACRSGETAPSPESPQAETTPVDKGKTVLSERRDEPLDSGTLRIGTRVLDRILRRGEELLRLKSAVRGHAGLLAEIMAVSATGASRSCPSQDLGNLYDSLKALHRQLEEDSHLAANLIDRLLEDMMDARLLPFSIHTVYLQKTARDLGQKLGKMVSLTVHGGESPVDKRLLERIKDPLVHLVRNSLDHGIESPEERSAAGKAASGKISIQIEQTRQDYLRIIFEDDGRGINIDKLGSRAAEQGLISATGVAALSDQEKLALILESGISTSAALSSISGRGLGMAIVREAVEGVGGSLHIESRPGRGTRFLMDLPCSVTRFHGTIVSVGDSRYIIPTRDLIKIVRKPLSALSTVEDRPVIHFNERPVSIELLGSLLGLRQEALENRVHFDTAIVETSGGTLGLVVDGVFRDEEMLFKDLGPVLKQVPGIAGAAILGDGSVVLILQVEEMIRTGLDGQPGSGATDQSNSCIEDERKATVLLAEDSVTARTQLEFFMREAGYHVISVPDGQRAREALEDHSIDILVSDVDMPRMNGFDLVRSIRKSAAHAALPIVLVTARETEEDRLAGLRAGADAYLEKSTFKQGDLLRMLERFA